MTDVLEAYRDEARRHDRADPLKKFRRRFFVQPGMIYLDGNSLGLLSRDSEAALEKTVREIF